MHTQSDLGTSETILIIALLIAMWLVGFAVGTRAGRTLEAEHPQFHLITNTVSQVTVEPIH